LTACGLQVVNQESTHEHDHPSIEIDTKQETFTKGQTVVFDVEVFSPTDTTVDIDLTPSAISLDQSKFSLDVKAGQQVAY
jgi:hypothetical protein